MPAEFGLDLVLLVSEFLAGGDAKLLANQIEPRDHLADRVLDLNPGVHLEEEELVAAYQRLDRSDAVVADRFGRPDAGRPQRFADALGNQGRCLFVEFLVTALQRAIALAHVHDVAVFVGHNLQLDVFRVVEIALDIERGILEVRLGLAPRRLEGRFQFVERPRDFEALSSAAA